MSLTTLTLMAAITLLLGSSFAQQPPAANSQPSATAKTQKTPAAKTHVAPGTKNSTSATKSNTGPALTTDKEKDSYALGLNIGRGLSKQPVDLDAAAVARGLKDALSGSKSLLTDEEAAADLAQLKDQAQKASDAKMQELGAENQKAGAAFLAENKTKEGVVTLPSGLQYKILTAGTGPKPTAADTVVCQYKGTLLDGTEFDSSYKRGQPATFAVGKVIKGWTEALQLMPVGSKWQLFIPADLAYGERGAGNVIPPNATLVFEVELVSIQAK
ncbi:MAG TPA: FKBP-type peptidyl-prolyl cis-trans isomerase [Verrucomicrobiae bacterium]|nr:FKBP-type peptidyl-prolyl cis-trans isomerase [Verrucomicrobiae bacterium]